MDSAKHKHTCLRCGHIWDGRKVGAPIYCPQCNSKRVVPELMGTLKEKIAQAIIFADPCILCGKKQIIPEELAEAILALLPPMLTKDEAHVAVNIWKCSDYCISCDYQDDCHDLRAKLKAIQEEE